MKRAGGTNVPVQCWEANGSVLATSDATPGVFATGKSNEEAVRRYVEMVQRLGQQPGISFVRPGGVSSVPKQGGVFYLGFPADSNFGDQWVYRSLESRLPDVGLFYLARTLEDRWSVALPRDRFAAFLLGGGTLINQQPYFYKEVCYSLGCDLPLLCFGTGVGEPDRWGDHRAAWVELLERFRYVGVRGPRAAALLTEAGLSGHRAVGDPCMLNPFEFDDPAASGCHRVALDLSFSAIEDQDSVTFRFLLLDWLNKLERAGRINVILFSTWDVYARWSEVQVQQVFGHAKPVTILRNGMGDLPPVELAIAYRLHAAAAALVRGIPTVAVSYEDKCMDFMEYAGLGDWAIDPGVTGFEAMLNLLGVDFSIDLAKAVERVRDSMVSAKAITEEHFLDFRSVLMEVDASRSGS